MVNQKILFLLTASAIIACIVLGTEAKKVTRRETGVLVDPYLRESSVLVGRNRRETAVLVDPYLRESPVLVGRNRRETGVLVGPYRREAVKLLDRYRRQDTGTDTSGGTGVDSTGGTGGDPTAGTGGDPTGGTGGDPTGDTGVDPSGGTDVATPDVDTGGMSIMDNMYYYVWYFILLIPGASTGLQFYYYIIGFL